MEAEAIRNAFKRLDQDGDGTISRDELAAVLRILDPKAYSNDATIDAAFQMADLDRNGRVDYDEFAAWICKDDTALRAAASIAERAGADEDSGSSDSEPDQPRPPEATTTEELYELMTMANGRVKGLLLIAPLVEAYGRSEETGLGPPLARLVPQACGFPESAAPLSTAEFAYLCKALSEAKKNVEEQDVLDALNAVKGNLGANFRLEGIELSPEASIGFKKFRLLLRTMSTVMRIDRRHLCAHFAWLRTGRFEMTTRTVDELLRKCFLKHHGARSRITANNFSRFCQSYGLVDEKGKTGLSYGSLGLFFRKLVDRMPALLAEREKRRTKPRGKELRRKTKSKGIRRRSSSAAKSMGGGSSSEEDAEKGSSIRGVAQVSVLMEELFSALPGSTRLRVSPLRFVLSLLEAEPADKKVGRASSRAASGKFGASSAASLGAGELGKDIALPADLQSVTVGWYRVTQAGKVQETIAADSKDIADISKGNTVQVVEVVHVPEERVLRARLQDPDGWISLVNTESREACAELIGTIDR